MAEGHPFILSSKDETASTFDSSFLPLLPCCGSSNFATHREAQKKRADGLFNLHINAGYIKASKEYYMWGML